MPSAVNKDYPVLPGGLNLITQALGVENYLELEEAEGEGRVKKKPVTPCCWCGE